MKAVRSSSLPPLASASLDVPAAAVLESLAVAILCVAIAAGPLALGGTLAWACFGIETAIATAAILWAFARPRPVTRMLLPLAIAALVLCQLLPLPDRVLTAIAPVSAGAWKVVHEGMPDAWGKISVTPAASAAAARRLLLGLAAILVVADLSRDPRRRRWLYTSLAIVGLLIWLAVFLFPVDPSNRSVYGVFSLHGPIEHWKTPFRQPMQTAGVGYLDLVTVDDKHYRADGAIVGDGVGAYIYSNHFANALCLTLPALCGMWLISTRKHIPRWIALLAVAGTTAAAAWTTGVLAGSRAGTAALLFGMTCYASLIAEHRASRWLAATVASIGACALIVFVAVFQGPLQGLITLTPNAWQPGLDFVMNDGRVAAARIAGRMFLASPVLGTGLGSFGDLFPRFVGRDDVMMYFAHNDHAQLLAEGGAVALVIAAWAATVLIWRFIRFCRERQPASRTIDAAAWAAVAGGAAHSVFDWNMHAPANAFLACVVGGLALSSVVPENSGRPPVQWSWASRLVAAVFTVAIIWASALLARDAALDKPLETLRRAITAARLAKSPDERMLAAEKLSTAVANGEMAHAWAPRDWPLPMLLGQARLHIEHIEATADATPATTASGDGARNANAAEWFRRAVLASPAYRGLPEPVPSRSPK